MFPISFIKYILYFVCSFAIVYIDQRDEVFSQSWKCVLLLILIINIVYHSYSSYKRPGFLKTSYMWGIKNALNFGLLDYPLKTVAYGVKFSILPVLCEYFDRKFVSKDKLFNIGLLFSQYIILANIPFLLGILTNPTTDDYTFEYDGEFAYSGIFAGQHPTAITTAMSMIFLLYAILRGRKNIFYRGYNVILFALAAYILYASFTRTGWAMGVFGIVIFISFNKLRLRTFAFEILLCLGLWYGYNYMNENNERFYNRTHDIINDGTYEADSGSGRLVYAAVSLQLFEDSNGATKLMGTGIDPLMDNMFNTIGNRIYSHNGWIDALTGNGIVGLTLMVLTCLFLIIYLLKHRKDKYSDITAACIAMYYSYQSTQGGVFFYLDLLLAVAIALIINGNKLQTKASVEMFGLKNITVRTQTAPKTDKDYEHTDN